MTNFASPLPLPGYRLTVGLTIQLATLIKPLTGNSTLYGITDITTFVLGTIFIVLLPGPNSVFVLSTASMHGIGAGYRAAAGVFVGDAILMLLASTGAASVLYANPTLFLVLKYAGAAYLAWIGVGLVREAITTWCARKSSELESKEPPAISSPMGSDSEFDRGQLAKDALNPQASGEATSATQSPLQVPSQSSLPPSADKPASVHASTKTTSKLAPSTRSPFRGALLISLLNPKAIFFFISFFVQFVDPKYEYPALTFLLLGIIVEICSLTYLAVLIHGGAHLANRMRRHPKLNALAAGTVGGIFIWFGLKLAQAKLS